MSKVSILIPVYNCEKFLPDCINSVLEQTHSNIEVLICDDGSSDSSLAILNKLATIDKRITIFQNEKNLGKIKTVNALISKSEGEFLTILDADDYIASEKISSQVTFLKNNDEYSFIASSFSRISELGSINSFHSIDYDYERIVSEILSGNPMALCCGSMLMVSEYAKKLSGYHPYFFNLNGEDLDFAARMLSFGKGKSTGDNHYFYRFRKNSLTRRVLYSPESRHSHEIVGFLLRQRINNQGKDSINSSLEGLDDFIASISVPYELDPKLMVRKCAVDYAINKEFRSSISYALRGFSFLNIESSLRTLFIVSMILALPLPVLFFIKSRLNFKNISKKI